MCARLLRHMHGTRAAADGWHSECASTLADGLGFSIGNASACAFYHGARDLRCSVHGDDLTTVGPKEDLDWFKAELEKCYELTEAHRNSGYLPGINLPDNLRGHDSLEQVLAGAEQVYLSVPSQSLRARSSTCKA